MSKDLCCGNCKHFKNEDVEGWGWCSFNKTKTHCAQSWDCHNSTFNGWTEITPDNVKEIESMPEVRVVVGCVVKGKMRIYTLSNFWFTPTAIAMQGGYYYYVLPKLKIE